MQVTHENTVLPSAQPLFMVRMGGGVFSETTQIFTKQGI